MTANPALLAVGLAAAPAGQGFRHVPAQLPQVTVSGHQAESIAIPVLSAKDCSGAAAGFCNGIRQLPDSVVVEALLKMQHVACPGIAGGDGCKDHPFQSGDPVFLGSQKLVHLPGGLSRLLNFGGEGLGYQFVLFIGSVQNGQRPFAAGHFHPGAAPEGDGGEQLHKTHFSGAGRVGAAAGAGIEAWHLHDPYRPGQGSLGAVDDGFQLFGSGNPAPDGQILPDSSIGGGFQFRQIFCRDHTVKVDGGGFRAHVKAGVVVAVLGVDQAGNDVFTGMLLHPVEPGSVIDLSFHSFACSKGTVAEMDDGFSLLPGVQHPDIAQCTGICGLSAPLGIEGGLVKNDGKALFCFFALQYLCGKPAQVAVNIIQLSGFHNSPRWDFFHYSIRFFSLQRHKKAVKSTKMVKNTSQNGIYGVE